MGPHFGALLGSSKTFLQIVGTIPRLSSCSATVLILGETGTGKDLFARSIHYLGPRQGKPFVPVNCAALPDHLIENELFGHSKGAYTDAAFEQQGLMAEADGGTLLLDEVNSLSLSAQGKLLRVLQDGEYRPLGSSKSRMVDIRIIAATNSDLRYLVQTRQFREDLFHRLNVLSIFIPPLRERREDIPLLAQHFLSVYGRQQGREDLRFSTPALEKLLDYEWPGNVRELEGVIQRAVVLAGSSILWPNDIELHLSAESNGPFSWRGYREYETNTSDSFHKSKVQVIERFERTYLTDLLTQYRGNITQAARSAGKERRSFQRLLRKYGLDRHAFLNSA